MTPSDAAAYAVAGLLAKFWHPGGSQPRSASFDIINRYYVSGLVPEHNIRPNATGLSVVAAETVLDIVRTDARQTFEVNSRAKCDVHGCTICLQRPLLSVVKIVGTGERGF